MHRWQRYELDPGFSIDYPALTDVRLPETSALIKAMRTADQLRTASHTGYPAAVGSPAGRAGRLTLTAVSKGLDCFRGPAIASQDEA
jgi:hypothetical protein